MGIIAQIALTAIAKTISHCARKRRGFKPSSPPAQKLVMILGGILRIADALDRTHSGRIARAEASVSLECITVWVEPTGTWEAENA